MFFYYLWMPEALNFFTSHQLALPLGIDDYMKGMKFHIYGDIKGCPLLLEIIFKETCLEIDSTEI